MDPLTGLLKRDAFDEILHAAFQKASQDNAPLALAFFDIDYFLQANETYGHQGGDAILATVFSLFFVLQFTRSKHIPANTIKNLVLMVYYANFFAY